MSRFATHQILELGLHFQPLYMARLQIQAERVLKLQSLAAEATHGSGSLPAKPLRWYIMTSPFTHDDTLEHFEMHGFFGLEREQIFFFQQGDLPALTEEGGLNP